MSQAGIVNVSGQSGVVDSVEGTAPIQVNGVSDTPETGNVDVSITAATAGTSMTALLGAASFNSTYFTVVGGFVSAISGSAGIATINGDSGSISGSTVTIYANQASVNSGSSVKFVNSGTTSTFNVTDANFNTIIGNLAGNTSLSGSNTVALGYKALAALTSANNNTAIGYQALTANTTSPANVAVGMNTLLGLTGGSGDNTAIGEGVAEGLLTGSANVIIGHGSGSSYAGSESNNILIAHSGVLGESGVIRIGEAPNQTSVYIAGITGATPTSGNTPQVVLCDNAGNLTPISSNTSGYVLTSNGSATPSFKAASSGSSTYFSSYLSTIEDDVTGDNTLYQIICDTALSNVGSNYNTSTGVFTAPATGFYTFNKTITSTPGTGVTQLITYWYGSTFNIRSYQEEFVSGAGNFVTSDTISIPMTMGDTMGIAVLMGNAGSKNSGVYGSATTGGNTTTLFSGYRVA